MRDETFYLHSRAGRWYYYRSVPQYARDFDRRGLVRISLKTKAVVIARKRRDLVAAADSEYWSSLLTLQAEDIAEDERQTLKNRVDKRYQAARVRALTFGLSTPSPDCFPDGLSLKPVRADNGDASRHLRQYNRIAGVRSAPRPDCRISEAFEIFCEKAAVSELATKSGNQKRAWLRSKARSIRELTGVIGDRKIDDVNRVDAQRFYAWWAKRLTPKIGGPVLSTKTANKSIGNVRKIIREYYAYFGDEDRINLFRGLSFKEVNVQTVFPLDNDWVRQRILKPGALDGVRDDARHALFALIETGCRICEIANLGKQDIVLDTVTPYLRIRPQRRRELKTQHTKRDIPLVGIALEAMRRFPSGFPDYRDRSDRLSGYLNAALRERDLLPTSHHKLSSFRHAFEKRMLEAGIDYGLRCELMGHVNERPKYGDGGSMGFRREQLLKIAHQFDRRLFPA